jgi:hypothetical protein
MEPGAREPERSEQSAFMRRPGCVDAHPLRVVIADCSHLALASDQPRALGVRDERAAQHAELLRRDLSPWKRRRTHVLLKGNYTGKQHGDRRRSESWGEPLLIYQGEDCDPDPRSHPESNGGRDNAEDDRGDGDDDQQFLPCLGFSLVLVRPVPPPQERQHNEHQTEGDEQHRHNRQHLADSQQQERLHRDQSQNIRRIEVLVEELPEA